MTVRGGIFLEGLVFDIQRFSIHDGPGIRTTVFLKGCNVRCYWCHNPESWKSHPELQIFPQKCIGCGNCFEVCPVGAHRILEGKREFLRELCRSCGKCAEGCYAGALVLVGKLMTVQEVMSEVEKDRPFYETSDGGVTFSGGEPLLQKDFIHALLVESKNMGFHTAVDTAGNVSWKVFDAILPYVDLFLFDVKTVNEKKHIEGTGVSNERIIENLKKLSAIGVRVWIRVPIIPGFNDNEKDMGEIADLVGDLANIELIELKPFHRLGKNKYDSLGLEYPCADFEAPSSEDIALLINVFTDRGLLCQGG